MSSVYAYLKPVGLHESMENVLYTDSPEELMRFSAPLERDFEDIKCWAKDNGGQALASFGGQICIQLPNNKVPDLTQFIHKLESSTVTFAIGIGLTICQAYKAMCTSDHECGSRVVLYSEDLDKNLLEKAEGDANHTHDINFNNLDLSEGNSQEAPKEKETTKQKVVQALMMVKEKAGVIEKLKEMDPKAYQAVKKVVEAMLLMAQKPVSTGAPPESDGKQ